MSEGGAIHIAPDERRIVRAILTAYVPDATVWVYGSRATGRALKPWSDLDLAILDSVPLDRMTQLALAEAFDESDLPWKVDLIDWATTSDRFRAIIAPDLRVLVPGRLTA